MFSFVNLVYQPITDKWLLFMHLIEYVLECKVLRQKSRLQSDV